MQTIKKLPGMSRGGCIGSIVVGSLYVFGALVIMGIIINAFRDSDPGETETLAESEPSPTAVATATPEQDHDMPEIQDHHIDSTVEFMADEPQVQDVTISVSDDTVTVAIIVGAATNEEHAQDVIDSAVRWLASRVADSYNEIDSPSSDHLGGIWDYYELQVGAGPDAETFYARGAKARNSPQISWD